jgi:hypothetical protein
MRRSAVCLVAALIVACGGPQAPAPGASEPPAPPSTGPLHDVHSAALSAWTTQAKVALSVVGQRDVAVQVANPDDFEAEPAPVLCTVGGSECVGYAGSYPGIHCAHVGFDNVCAVSQPATTLFYAETVSVQNGQVSFPVPCDGRSYQAEVFAAAGGVILDAKRTAAPLSFDASCQGAAASWADEPRPALVVPTVYAGPLPAPYDRYTVNVQGLGVSPWSPGFTVTCNSAAPLAYGVGSAIFPAPPVGTPQVACTAAVPLDRSLLTGAEAASPWTIQLQATGSVIGATMVTSP